MRPSGSRLPRLAGEPSARLLDIQNDLFDLGADVATPGEVEGALRIVASQVERLEREIDEMNAMLAPLTSFILPSGSAGVSALHLARTIVRRAERAAVALNESEPLNPHLLAYLNRLSDHLFVAARFVAAGEGGDVLWTAGGVARRLAVELEHIENLCFPRAVSWQGRRMATEARPEPAGDWPRACSRRAS